MQGKVRNKHSSQDQQANYKEVHYTLYTSLYSSLTANVTEVGLIFSEGCFSSLEWKLPSQSHFMK